MGYSNEGEGLGHLTLPSGSLLLNFSMEERTR